jgi:hypothetical protein
MACYEDSFTFTLLYMKLALLLDCPNRKNSLQGLLRNEELWEP